LRFLCAAVLLVHGHEFLGSGMLKLSIVLRLPSLPKQTKTLGRIVTLTRPHFQNTCTFPPRKWQVCSVNGRQEWGVMLVRIICTLFLVLMPYAEKRVALVIGNSAYEYTGELTNPRNDATDMGAALKKHGFQVIDGFDLDKVAFERKLREFAEALTGSDAGVFFYAGHGLQVSGQNYLVPIDAKAEGLESLGLEVIKANLVQSIMEDKTSTNVLFLGACRNNPLARNLARSMGTRSIEVGSGLAPVESGIGTLISYSTAQVRWRWTARVGARPLPAHS
jgi:hypothetical protein